MTSNDERGLEDAQRNPRRSHLSGVASEGREQGQGCEDRAAGNRAIAQDRQAAEEGSQRMSIYNARGAFRCPSCAAKTRSGAPCRNPVVRLPDGAPGKRCRMHSGRGTGPRVVTKKQMKNLKNYRECETAAC